MIYIIALGLLIFRSNYLLLKESRRANNRSIKTQSAYKSIKILFPQITFIFSITNCYSKKMGS